ncbi:MAG TPA: tRNA (adenosine(37)-N6)-threonylcarbamoyltransferase complex dimerization subunit type 1 TsaB [Nitriliruptorales bacterium]|nr:tRNA (adenosine(37)-N6)-threonylcarbamoyltransferase complex dimerization subunit type 1 TsaB [Nitriliruptorales bacterium]
MIVLSIETSTPRSSVCLARPAAVVASASLGIERRHSEFVTPAIEFCLRQSGLTVGDITGVAVGIGPGLYTGLRVGMATAKAFASARRLPVVGMCGLDVLAFQVRHVRNLICAAIDARRGELFWAFYRRVPGGVQRDSDLRIGRPSRLAGEIEGAGRECLAIGDGALRYADELADAGAEIAGMETAWPDAGDLAELAIPRFLREDTQRPDELQPLYLRVADARIGWATRGRLRGGAGAVR